MPCGLALPLEILAWSGVIVLFVVALFLVGFGLAKILVWLA